MNRLKIPHFSRFILLFWLGMGGIHAVVGQQYLAQYAPVEALLPENNAVACLKLAPESAERYVTGTIFSSDLGRKTAAIWLTDAQSKLDFTQVIFDPTGVLDLEGQDLIVTDNKEIWIGGSIVDNGKQHGLLAHMGNNGEILQSFFWRNSPVIRVDYDANADVLYAVANGLNDQGEKDLRLLIMNGQGNIMGGFSMETSQEDGVSDGILIPGNEGYTLIGWQSQGAECLPVWITVHPEEGQLQSIGFIANLPILSVESVSYLESESLVGVTGTALADNGVDTLAYLLTLDREGTPQAISYYRPGDGLLVRPKAIQAYEESTSGNKGFILTGQYQDSLSLEDAYAWATRLAVDGTPKGA